MHPNLPAAALAAFAKNLPSALRLPAWRKRLALTALALSSLGAGAQTYLIDFGGANLTARGPAPNDPNNYWNNIGTAVGGTDAGVLAGLVSSLNTTSSISLRMVSRFNGANENGTQNSAAWPINATRDSLYGNTESFNGLVNIYPVFKLSGLDAATTYGFTFFGSRTGVSDNRETKFTVTGGNSSIGYLNAANNVSETLTVANITPDAAGEISIAMTPGPNNNNANHFTYLGILKVDAIPPQTPLSFTTQPASQRVVQLKPATFTTAVSGPPPYTVQWYQNGQPLPGANQFSLTLPSVTMDMNGYAYSVSVSNLAYGVLSTNAILTVLSDTNPPVLLKAASYDGNNIVATFNEPLNFTLYDAANYQVNNGSVVVWGALPNESATQVTIGLLSPITGTFTLKVNNLQDIAGNPIAPNTTVTGVVVPIEDQPLLFDFGAGGFMTTFGPPPNDPDFYWNNVSSGVATSDTGEQSSFISAYNAASPVALAMLSRFNGVNENGSLLATVFPQQATRDSLFGNTEDFGGLTNIYPRFKLTGLSPAQAYSLTFYASRTGVSDNRETAYTVEGANTVVTKLNPANNLDTTATAAGVTPTPTGEITISLTPTAANNNANHFTYLGVLKVERYVLPPHFLSPVIQGNQIRLAWVGSGQLLSAPSVSGPWTAITPAPTSPYSENIVPGQHRFYRLEQTP